MVPLYIILSAMMFAWNVLLAGRIAQLRRAPRNFVTLAALCGLLLAPALLIAFAASSILYGRAMQPLLWVWPVVSVMFLVQVMYALSKRLVTPMFGVPIMLYNAVIAAVAPLLSQTARIMRRDSSLGTTAATGTDGLDS